MAKAKTESAKKKAKKTKPKTDEPTKNAKKTTKQKKPRKKPRKESKEMKVVLTPVKAIQAHPENPRRGSIEAIKDSLKKNGQFRPLIVQESTKYIIGGNHTWKAAKSLGWENIRAIFLDVTDEQAARIMLADNRTSDLATYDGEALADILKTLDEPHVGTGYTDEDVNNLVSAIESENEVMVNEVLRPEYEDTDDDDEPTFTEDDYTVEDDDFDLSKAKGDDKEGDFEKAEEELQGVHSLKFDTSFPGHGYWEIPKLRDDMLVSLDELNSVWPLESWAGSATKDWPNDDQWWLYNVGIDSTSGMKDVSKCVVSFYCWDEYYENWWVYPERYTSKMLNSGIKYAVTPDFSMFIDQTRTSNLWSLFKNRWLGRYFQEAGVKVIPNISWRYDDMKFMELVLGGVPKGLDVIAFQAHTGIFDLGEEGQVKNKHKLDTYGKQVKEVARVLKPKALLLYAGDPGHEYHKKLGMPWKLYHVDTRLTKLGEKARQRERKRTL